MAGLRKIKNAFCPTLKDGTRPKRKIMLYGFFGNNLGDDIFFDILLKRYPDTLFYAFFTAEYEPFFAKYNNIRYYSYTRPIVDKINRLGGKFGDGMLFEEMLLKICDGAVHIGGSVYQQIGDYEHDLFIRKKRHRHAGSFFGITNNFGPFTTEKFKNDWENEFKKFTAVSFRDRYSYDLFYNLKNVSYAPDLLFSIDPPKTETKKNTVAVSVINPHEEFRGIDKALADNYMRVLTELCECLAEKGYVVNLLGFCNLENDTGAINEIRDGVSENLKERVHLFPYTNDFTDTLDLIASSEYVLSTRFHASVLGYAFSKKVLPVSYNIKVKNMLADIGENDYIEFEHIGDYSGAELAEKLTGKSVLNIDKARAESKTHFDALDKFISQKNGTIVPEYKI